MGAGEKVHGATAWALNWRAALPPYITFYVKSQPGNKNPAQKQSSVPGQPVDKVISAK